MGRTSDVIRRLKKPMFKKRRKAKNTRMVKYTGSGLTAKSPFPKTFKFTTKWVETNINIQAGAAGAMGTHVFNMNSLYRPDTFAGDPPHQPIGFDQIMPLYDHFVVIGSRIRVTAQNQDNAQQQVLVLSLKDNDVPEPNGDTLLENGMNRYCLLSLEKSGAARKTLTLNCSPSKFFGRSVTEGDKYQGTIIASPLEGVFCHVSVFPQNAVQADPVNCIVEIEYVALLTEPVTLAGS